MLSKSDKIYIKSLKDKKTRYIRNEFVAEGSRIVLDLIKAAPDKLKFLYATTEWYTKFEPIIAKNAEMVHIISSENLQDIASLKTTEEVLAIFSIPERPFQIQTDIQLNIYLENIRDPGNLGSIIRSADWFGIKQLFCSPECVDPYNNKCVQATMASIMRVNLIQKTWHEMLELFPTVDKYAATADGISIYKIEKESIRFICIGNEANGLSPEILKDCKEQVSIPDTYSLGAESLNAAIACSIIMGLWRMKN